MKVIDKLTKSGKITNEDAFWYTDNCVVLLDGSTPLKKSMLSVTDFVNSFISIFSNQIKKCDLLVDMVNETILSLNDMYNVEQLISDNTIFPSAAGLIVFETENELQIFSLGDCTALLWKNQDLQIIKNSEVSAFDQQVFKHMLEIQKVTNDDICDIVKLKEISRHIINNRKMMNKPNGYRIISLDLQPIDENDILHFDKHEIDKMTLFSDGFDLVKDDIIKDELNSVELYKKLRDLENEDCKLNKYPRFKISDDASIIKIRF